MEDTPRCPLSQRPSRCGNVVQCLHVSKVPPHPQACVLQSKIPKPRHVGLQRETAKPQNLTACQSQPRTNLSRHDIQAQGLPNLSATLEESVLLCILPQTCPQCNPLRSSASDSSFPDNSAAPHNIRCIACARSKTRPGRAFQGPRQPDPFHSSTST
jgi:hypothetical protein